MSGGDRFAEFRAAVLTILFDRNVHRNWPCREPCINKTRCNYTMHSFCMQRDNNENLLHSFCRTGPVYRQRVKSTEGVYSNCNNGDALFRSNGDALVVLVAVFWPGKTLKLCLEYVSPFIFDSLLPLRFAIREPRSFKKRASQFSSGNRRINDVKHLVTPRKFIQYVNFYSFYLGG